VGEALDEGALELSQRPVLDLAHALLRDAEPVAEEFERDLLLLEPARAQDAQFALVEDLERLLEPAHPALAVDHVGDALVGQGRAVDQELHPLGRVAGIRVHDGRIERGVGAERRASMRATSALETPIACAMVAWTSLEIRSSPPRVRRARRRRRLKNRAFWAEEVPPRTMDQLRRM
jgi:hypothetical protein